MNRFFFGCWVVLGGFGFLSADGPNGTGPAPEIQPQTLQLIDLFDIENVSEPQISPDGRTVAFLRHAGDIMKDRRRTTLWSIQADGEDLRPIVSGSANVAVPRWSPDGKRLLYASSAEPEGAAQIFVRWMDSGQAVQVTSVQKAPKDMTWSPDGKWIAFTMLAPQEAKPFAPMPKKPEGADWGKPARLIQNLQFRTDAEGFLPEGYSHIFIVPSDGGTPRQLTQGASHHRGPLSWDSQGETIYFSSNLHEEWELTWDTEIYSVTRTGLLTRLTSREGMDAHPVVSPDGQWIAYVGFDDQLKGYQVRRLYLMKPDGTGKRMISRNLDRDVESPVWKQDGSGLYFLYDEQGNTKLAFIDLGGRTRIITGDVGGVSYSRPYDSGSFTVSTNGVIAFTQTGPDFPADLAVVREPEEARRLTRLNDDLFQIRELGAVEEIRYASSLDGREIQGWIVKPPRFDSSRKYPLILEIHGGPFANYGDRFASEMQLYAAAGYVVLYTNPRGSTSYGEEFGNLIHHNYPGGDYDDLISGVDAVLKRGYVDEDNLFVTGGSGGGVLTAWIIGKTDRFRAAVAAKPVINWQSFVLTSDIPLIHKYWFPGLPWEDPEPYLRRSPISLIGNVKTPTMLITGELDYRTPMSESEQYFTALKLRKVDAALLRLPGASHNMEAKTTHLIAKVAHTLKWFDTYRTGQSKRDAPAAALK